MFPRQLSRLSQAVGGDVADCRNGSERCLRFASARGRGNKDTEVALPPSPRLWRTSAKLLRAEGIRGWRRQVGVRIGDGKRGKETTEILRQAQDDRRGMRSTTVRVDFIFRKQRLIIFVDGCFWHGCPVHSSPGKWLRKSSMKGRAGGALGEHALPTARTGKLFWAAKLAGNMARDRFVTRGLRREGWKVVRIWEHDLAKNPGRCVERIRRAVGCVRKGKSLATVRGSSECLVVRSKAVRLCDDGRRGARR
jgi:DNA mismatch endonuclease, patch repair protein